MFNKWHSRRYSASRTVESELTAVQPHIADIPLISDCVRHICKLRRLENAAERKLPLTRISLTRRRHTLSMCLGSWPRSDRGSSSNRTSRNVLWSISNGSWRGRDWRKTRFTRQVRKKYLSRDRVLVSFTFSSTVSYNPSISKECHQLINKTYTNR